MILITHNHWDHLQGLETVLNQIKVPITIGKSDAKKIEVRDREIIYAEDNQLLKTGDISIRAISTPGHTPGSTCFMLASESPASVPHVFTGDTLFPGGPGKSRSHKAFLDILKSIETKLFTLPSESIVLPGHGKATTIKNSKDEFEVFRTKPVPPGLYGEVTWGEN